jgi:hypothetical protein
MRISRKVDLLITLSDLKMTFLPVDATTLDVWVLDHLRSLLQNATTDSTLNSQLRSEKVVFFLHLLGLDTTGHSYRPHSKVTKMHFYLSL